MTPDTDASARIPLGDQDPLLAVPTMQFRNPSYGDVDLALEKRALTWKEINFGPRADFFNSLNRSGWNSIENVLADFASMFGATNGTSPARVGQVSAKIDF
jgi:hypothetical protein